MAQQDIVEQIKSDIQNNKILIYMKGTPEAPQCGFSAATVELFKNLGAPFASRDVIANPELRAKLPEFSSWPTFPQVFINGKLIGGCDIVHEMHERGELEPLVREALSS
jgi:monothiol glutaredoxin